MHNGSRRLRSWARTFMRRRYALRSARLRNRDNTNFLLAAHKTPRFAQQILHLHSCHCAAGHKLLLLKADGAPDRRLADIQHAEQLTIA